ncbi:hypothetical protein NUU61_002758 [Penicillium alfredii]|uniref:Uncharacterized protein n=1 Tax=Penicillium alfredii TaxID=1506179 RepID=A0A9W9FS33_9EURO|nr:uncharacterized protein NUU61_002758 [Penicillium alfredii]KAJ5105411.1 hypothetical protein NUU61_002758 [Penicillium alfredii]
MSPQNLKLQDPESRNAPATEIATEFNTMPGFETQPQFAGTAEYSDTRLFAILDDFLQSNNNNTETSHDSAVRSILRLVPDGVPLLQEVSNVGQVILEIAEQIPYYHPAHVKLARVLEEPSISPKFMSGPGLNGLYQRSQRFDREREIRFEGNFSAFLAHVSSAHIGRHDPSDALMTMQNALETPLDGETLADRKLEIITAAQYILWDGQGLFKHALCPYPNDGRGDWKPGLLCIGEHGLTLERWRFWKKKFERITAGDSGVDEECREVSRKAVVLMDAIEE